MYLLHTHIDNKIQNRNYNITKWHWKQRRYPINSWCFIRWLSHNNFIYYFKTRGGKHKQTCLQAYSQKIIYFFNYSTRKVSPGIANHNIVTQYWVQFSNNVTKNVLNSLAISKEMNISLPESGKELIFVTSNYLVDKPKILLIVLHCFIITFVTVK